LLAALIFGANGIADAARLLAGEGLEGLIGVIAVGAILYVLSRENITRGIEK
jgi:hypothetical protein